MALGFMRRHKRWLYVFLWVVIAAFIILYIPAFQGADAGSPGDTYAEVGGEKITVAEFQRAYDMQRRRLEQTYRNLDPETLEQLGLEDQTLSMLVDEKLVALEADRLGIRIDDATLSREISRAPELQRDGKFIGAGEVKRRLELAGLTPQDYEETLRARLKAERLMALVTDGITVSLADAEREFRRRNEQVKVEYVLVPTERFRAQVQASEDETRTRFESRKEDYRIPEKRVISYVLVDSQGLESRVALTDPEIDSYYQEHREDYKEEEQVCASHILVKVKASPDAKEGHTEDEAKGIAQSALDQLKGGAEFSALAKKLSEDKMSGSNGGDLGCFSRGRMVPDFENAAFGLKAGELSDLVRSPYGFHVIRVASRRDERIPALGEMKERIRQILLGRKARALAQEKTQAVAAGLRRGRPLDDVAKKEGLAVQKSEPFGRSDRIPALESPQLMARAFELKKAEVVKEPFAVARGYAFIALSEIQDSHLPELKEVQEKVKADVLDEKALRKAETVAEDLRAAAEKGGLEKAATALGLVRKETPSLVGRGSPVGDLGAGLALEEAVFGLTEKALSTPVRAPGGYAVLRVLEKKPFDAAAFEKEKESTMSALKNQRREQFFRVYLSEVRERFPVEKRTSLRRPS